MIADNLKTAILLPEAAILVNLPVEPLICVAMLEKVSDYKCNGQYK